MEDMQEERKLHANEKKKGVVRRRERQSSRLIEIVISPALFWTCLCLRFEKVGEIGNGCWK